MRTKTDATFEQARHILQLVSDKGTPKEQVTALIQSGLLSDILDANVEEVDREALRKALGLTPRQLKIILNYGSKQKPRTLAEMIATGNYDWTNSDITAERFPIVGEGTHELVPQLIRFNRIISSDDAERDLDQRKLRPGKIEELLAVGATYPNLQRQFSIIALGSVAGFDDGRRVACLDRDGSERCLDLFYRTSGWSESCRFLAFEKALAAA